MESVYIPLIPGEDENFMDLKQRLKAAITKTYYAAELIMN